jgi:hypothetical protein
LGRRNGDEESKGRIEKVREEKSLKERNGKRRQQEKNVGRKHRRRYCAYIGRASDEQATDREKTLIERVEKAERKQGMNEQATEFAEPGEGWLRVYATGGYWPVCRAATRKTTGTSRNWPI